MSEDLSNLDTFPKLLEHHGRVRGERPAIREKDLGIWQTWTWAQVAAEVRALACGLAAQGFKRGMHLAIIGDNRPRLYWSMTAAQALGGVPVPMYQDAPAAEFAYVLNDAEITYAVVEDQEQVDKMLETMPQVPTLKHLYYDDSRGLRNYPDITSFDRLLEIEEACFGVDGYDRNTFADFYGKSRCPFLVALVAGKVCGYMLTCIGGRSASYRAEIISMPVAPEHGGQGFARGFRGASSRRVRRPGVGGVARVAGVRAGRHRERDRE